MRKNLIATTALASLLLTGCVSKIAQNPFGIGYEHSACEAASKGGVCGSPSNIYKFKDVIQKTQEDYRESGIKDEIFFGISPKGNMLVKSDREGSWERYEGSKIQEKINSRLAKKNAFFNPKANKSLSSEQPENFKRPGIFYKPNKNAPTTRIATPIREKSEDLEVDFKKSKSRIIETRTNVGQVIRDNGEVRKIWVAPVEDAAHDFVSAHEIYTVIREPKWIVGEETPKHIRNSRVSIPQKTPMPNTIKSKFTGKGFTEKSFEDTVRFENSAEEMPKLKTKEEIFLENFVN